MEAGEKKDGPFAGEGGVGRLEKGNTQRNREQERVRERARARQRERARVSESARVRAQERPLDILREKLGNKEYIEVFINGQDLI